MKLGTQTGSLVNHLLSRAPTTLPEIGDAATVTHWTDRSAATVINVFQKGKYNYVVVQEDNAVRVDDNGLSEIQDYEYTRNPEGITSTFRITDNGYEHVYLAETGRYNKSDSCGLCIGRRQKYHDPSF